MSLMVVVGSCSRKRDALAFPPFVYLSSVPGVAGGRIAERRVYYLGDDGTLQVSHETTSDEIIEARAGEVDAAALFAELVHLVSQMPSAPPRGSPAGGLVKEFAPPRVILWVQVPERAPFLWAGAPHEAPPPVATVRDSLEKLAEIATLPRLDGQAFIRASLVSDAEDGALRKAGVVAPATASQVRGNPVLWAAVSRPFRLIAVDERADAFAPFRRGFRPGRDTLELSVGGRVFQLRSYTQRRDRSGNGPQPSDPNRNLKGGAS